MQTQLSRPQNLSELIERHATLQRDWFRAIEAVDLIEKEMQPLRKRLDKMLPGWRERNSVC